MSAKTKTSRTVLRLCVLLAGMPGRSVPAPAAEGVVQAPVDVVKHGKSWAVVLSPALARALRRSFPGYSIPRLEQFADDAREMFRGQVTDHPALPFLCVGDFDGNGLTDVALLLQKLQKRRQQWLLVAFHQARAGEFRPHIIEHWNTQDMEENEWYSADDGKLSLYIYRSRGHEWGLHPRYDGIEVDSPGEWSEVFYYYRGGRYHSKFLTPNA